jgi:hypothetical protein
MTRPDEKVASDAYRQWEKAMGAWWEKVLETPSFLDGMGKGLEAQASARKQYEGAVDQAMSQWHLPSRSDVVRLARIAAMLEEKSLSLEDRMLEMGDALARAEREALKARVDAAETRVALEDRLLAIESRLEAIADKLDARAKKPVASRE